MTDKEFTTDGYEIVYISNGFYDCIEKWLKSMSRVPGGSMNFIKPISLRDEVASVEFRMWELKKENMIIDSSSNLEGHAISLKTKHCIYCSYRRNI